MLYPTMEQVEKADREQLARWFRFLPSPGMSSITCKTPIFRTRLKAEQKINDRICERFKEMGGMTPGVSKSIGWDT